MCVREREESVAFWGSRDLLRHAARQRTTRSASGAARRTRSQDTEGFDYAILHAIDLSAHRPLLIEFESVRCPRAPATRTSSTRGFHLRRPHAAHAPPSLKPWVRLAVCAVA